MSDPLDRAAGHLDDALRHLDAADAHLARAIRSSKWATRAAWLAVIAWCVFVAVVLVAIL